MKDIFGKTFKIGDYVVYAIRSGNSGAMKAGKVKEVADDYVSVNGLVIRIYNKISTVYVNSKSVKLYDSSTICAIGEKDVSEFIRNILEKFEQNRGKIFESSI